MVFILKKFKNAHYQFIMLNNLNLNSKIYKFKLNTYMQLLRKNVFDLVLIYINNQFYFLHLCSNCMLLKNLPEVMNILFFS